MRKVWALVLSLLLLSAPAVVAADAPDDTAPADETEYIESDAANGYFSEGEFRHRVLPQAITVIRVGLARTGSSETSDTGFDHFTAALSAESDFVVAKGTGEVLLQGGAGQPVAVAGTPAGYTLAFDNTVYGPFTEPLTFKATTGDMVNVIYATRIYPGSTSKLYKYHGYVELRPGVASGSFRIVNVVGLDNYLRGLAELPTSWQAEALKAQTVAARSYAAMRIGTPSAITRGFDIYDTSLSQVYNGALRENAPQDQAVVETAGLVVTYQQQVADCYYSSSAGGHTESYEYYVAPSVDQFPGTPIPYLTGVYDSIPPTPDLDLTTEEGVREFYSHSYPEHFDSTASSGNAYYRWSYSWTRQNLESILNTYLRQYGNMGWVRPAFRQTDSIGTLQDIRVEGRGTSGKALNLVIVGSNGTWKVTREYYIRWILRPTLSLTLRSANFFLDITRDSTGAITTVKATGGGFGHGVGMDQYGVRGMANQNYGFAEILYHYYTGAKVSTVPLKVRRLTGVPMDEAFRQQFYSPGGGTLEVTMNGLTNLQAVVNGQMVTVNAADCENGFCQVDITQWLQPGMNEIVYVPVGAPNGSAVVTVAVR